LTLVTQPKLPKIQVKIQDRAAILVKSSRDTLYNTFLALNQGDLACLGNFVGNQDQQVHGREIKAEIVCLTTKS